MKGDTLRDRIPVFSSLDPEDFALLEKSLVRRRYPAGTTLFHMGDDGGALHVIGRGRVKVTIPSPSGEELILAILSQGDILGELSLFDGKPRSATVEALEETDTLCFLREEVLKLMRTRFSVVERVLEVLCRRIRDTDTLLAEARFLDLGARLARKILDLGDSCGVREGEAVRIPVRVTQKDLASMIGGTRESVNKQMTALKGEGILAVEGGVVTILRREALRKKARLPQGR
jgi:CRP-like cAMP-binding protein